MRDGNKRHFGQQEGDDHGRKYGYQRSVLVVDGRCKMQVTCMFVVLIHCACRCMYGLLWNESRGR
jgi:hypothetical protein